MMQVTIFGGLNEVENRKTTTANNVYEIIASIRSLRFIY